ncbi:hypothetical protein CC85DRAFT_61584 [Cutaneotrichosporon oleaginosum]|uniref:Uncharacterized protein n=1 Tax=Cutaneotrichosporon oleaginosum TaxID=879819 RepID=A0A0J0XQA6_9TREE|nr:uncharacterized protein CC85DRAFT_61584 [Cutaneotrichosporon oleaginosum]KLT43301.1 hypothetical protein CC85DRAFT_61584 [Cutaneotrichosporon oleaginosum]TXT14436.1 hypothetical protein COLE_00629 [Cutaneotrichosporon oleaginosum]
MVYIVPLISNLIIAVSLVTSWAKCALPAGFRLVDRGKCFSGVDSPTIPRKVTVILPCLSSSHSSRLTLLTLLVLSTFLSTRCSSSSSVF